MKLALIADIHSNLPALKAVLEELKKEKVARIIHAGDVVGYNPWPNEVIEVLKENKILSILGNHDRAVLSENTFGFNPYAAQAVLWTIDKLSKENISWLRALKTREKLSLDLKIALIHGSPWDDDEYVYDWQLTPAFLEEVKSEILIYGHTHVPGCKKFSNGIIINPGSVGQPRDGNPKASYAILELPSKEIELKRVEYDVKSVMDQILKEALPAPLAHRLALGM